MKIIDIHTKKETTNYFPYENGINKQRVKKYVLQNINFPKTDEYWNIIDNSFAEIWNNKLGIGGYFYCDEISKQINSILQQQKMLIEYERLDKIINLILTFFQENNGGFLK